MTQQMPESQEPDWTITGTEDTFGPIGPGGALRMKRVKFVTRDGQESYVDVPMTGDWRTAAIKAVAKHAEELLGFVGVTSADFA